MEGYPIQLRCISLQSDVMVNSLLPILGGLRAECLNSTDSPVPWVGYFKASARNTGSPPARRLPELAAFPGSRAEHLCRTFLIQKDRVGDTHRTAHDENSIDQLTSRFQFLQQTQAREIPESEAGCGSSDRQSRRGESPEL